MSRILSLVPFLLLVFAVALFGSFFTPDEWYRSLNLPSWQPPDWIFAPVWTILYLFIALSGWVVWRTHQPGARTGLVFWGVQLVFNGAWSWLFFGLHRPGLALIDVLFLLAAVLVTFILFLRISKTAGLLFLPYLLWVSYASVLNLAIWRMNP